MIYEKHIPQAGDRMRILLNGRVIYNGSDFLTIESISTPTLQIGITPGLYARYIRIPVSADYNGSGRHTLTVEIYSSSGRVLRDTAVYGVFGSTTPPA